MVLVAVGEEYEEEERDEEEAEEEVEEKEEEEEDGFEVVKPCRERHNECNAEMHRLNPRTSDREGPARGLRVETQRDRETGKDR